MTREFKTFPTTPSSAPTSDYQVANKKYVDDNSGGGSPAGSTGEIQYNDSGSFGASSSLVWDTTNGRQGINTTTPRKRLDILDSTNAQLRLTSVENTYYTDIHSTATGDFYIRSLGTTNNIGIGRNVMEKDAGELNIGFGYNTLLSNTGSNNQALAFYGLLQNTGNRCLGLGYSPLGYNEGDYNTAIGNNAWSSFLTNSSGAKTFSNTNIDIATDRITITGHGFGSAGEYTNLRYTQGTSTISGMTDNVIYQVKIVDADTIGFNEDGDGRDITNAGSGTGHTLTPQYKYNSSIVIGNDVNPTASNQIRIGKAITTDEISETVTIAQSSWFTPTFQNSWVNFGTPHEEAGYMKDSMGFVHLRGLIKSGTASLIFTLPSGYRPKAQQMIATITATNAFGRLDIKADGSVEATSYNNGYFSLNNVTFKAE